MDSRFDPAFQPDDRLRDALADFVALVRHLRRDCPWDREQTHASTRSNLLEEAYEAADAIDREDWPDFSKELGDVLLHVVFHSVIAEGDGRFTLLDVVTQETEKLVRRHPHVFGDAAVSGTTEVLANWEAIKVAERAAQGAAKPKGVLSGLPKALPALVRAQRTQEKVAGVGFDFPDADGAWAKVDEELGEYRAAATEQQRQAELGDVLFALVNHARLSGLDAEAALQATNDRFARRFGHVEARLEGQGRSPKDATLDEMDALWDEAKAEEKAGR
ncbi:MAG: nucleoside triphosphate pyrophosphohydrolase [Bacteroidetes bacterium]|nr:nucleoside triphosphate pyrophosphohydrolase [Bacteroidota bacterium]